MAGERGSRRKSEIWLVGQTSSSVPHSKLPSKRDVLSLFFHFQLEKHARFKEASLQTAMKVVEVWDKAKIPTKKQQHIIAKVEGMVNEWKKLKKNRNNKKKRSEGLKKKEDVWAENLDELFDIAHRDALDLMKIEEDKLFLLSQRKHGRPGRIGGLDKTHTKKVAKSQTRKVRLQKRKAQAEEEIQAIYDEKVVFVSSTSDSEAASSRSGSCSPVKFLSIPGPSSSATQPPASKRGRKE